MPWQSQLNENSLSWLLEAANPDVRYLALRDLLDHPADDPQLRAARTAAHQHGPIDEILKNMNEPGYWYTRGPGYNRKYFSTVWALLCLAQLGASVQEDERLATACDYYLEHMAPGGQFATSSSGAPSSTVDCLQGNMCWALLELGCQDERLEKAFEWMARSQTGEGMAPMEEKYALPRYYAYKCAPNFVCGVNENKPCAWGAVKVMMAFGRLPANKRTPLIDCAMQQGIDLLFSVDPALATYPTRNNIKPSRDWWKFGFPVFYITDLLQLVEALSACGYGHDPRLANALQIIREKQDEHGRWSLEFDYNGKTWVNFGEKKQPNKWVTLRAMRVLKATYTV